MVVGRWTMDVSSDGMAMGPLARAVAAACMPVYRVDGPLRGYG